MTAQSEPLQYLGDPDLQPKPNRQARVFPYLPKPSLIEAVNLAIALDRPLLIQGEPGCGKTLLARAIAYEFSQRYLKGKAEWPFFSWNVKSNSTAQEGRYTYDALGKLRDAQLVGTPQLEQFLDDTQRQKLIDRLSNPEGYIKWGPLGLALQECDRRPILLIDEIDKADIDFPNDLLCDLEEGYFIVDETQQQIPEKPGANKPIVIITSNQERELPEAFLRRCLFFYLPFPDETHLRQIVECHFPRPDRADIIKNAIAKFLEIRSKGRSRSQGKQASTSELLDWLSVLIDDSEAAAKIEKVASDPAQLGILLKSRADLDRVLRKPPAQPKSEPS
ncbi:AAA family ATPase [Baaleninema simplex]|uniref:AAA family ATPase n=1 Tax=Baaleninema simplex TaxID=2862350 RepID=UPI00034912FA|nr:MoxR family ATPase [Baaleninema simplex]